MTTSPLSASLRFATAASLVVAIASIFTPPASATVFVDVSAGGTSLDPVQADNSGDLNPPGNAVHGIAVVTDTGGGAFVAPGPMPSCDAPPLGFTCALAGPGGIATGEVRGDLGLLRATASTTTHVVVIDPEHGGVAGLGSAFADTTVRLADGFLTGSAGPVTFHLHVDVDISEFGPADIIDEDRFELTFSLFSLFDLSFPEFDFAAPDHSPGHIEIDKTFVMADVPAGTSIGMSLEMRLFAECGVNAFEFGGTDCAISIDAGHTAYLGVEGDVLSASGYSYPGFAAAVSVPAPASLALFTLGLIGMGAGARARKTR